MCGKIHYLNANTNTEIQILCTTCSGAPIVLNYFYESHLPYPVVPNLSFSAIESIAKEE